MRSFGKAASEMKRIVPQRQSLARENVFRSFVLQCDSARRIASSTKSSRFPHVFREETQHEIPMLLQQRILATVSPVCLRA